MFEQNPQKAYYKNTSKFNTRRVKGGEGDREGVRGIREGGSPTM